MAERETAVLVRLTHKEKSFLQKQADNAGLKMEPYIRRLIAGKKSVRVRRRNTIKYSKS